MTIGRIKQRLGFDQSHHAATILVVTALTTAALLNWVRVTRSEPSPYTVRWLTVGATPLALGLFLGNAIPIAVRTRNGRLIRDAGPLAIVQVIVLTQWGIAVGGTLYGATGPVAAVVILAGLLAVYYALEARTLRERPFLNLTHLITGTTLASGLSGYWILTGNGSSFTVGLVVLAVGVCLSTIVRL